MMTQNAVEQADTITPQWVNTNIQLFQVWSVQYPQDGVRENQVDQSCKFIECEAIHKLQ